MLSAGILESQTPYRALTGKIFLSGGLVRRATLSLIILTKASRQLASTVRSIRFLKFDRKERKELPLSVTRSKRSRSLDERFFPARRRSKRKGALDKIFLRERVSRAAHVFALRRIRFADETIKTPGFGFATSPSPPVPDDDDRAAENI